MYKFKTSEQNNDKATEFETKSLLYLLTKIKGHSGISLFIIDCFNDVTGVSENYSDSWDIQSKNVASLTPRTVGKALYTLFANYVSNIPFGHFILYLPQLKESYVENISTEVFDISNFKKTKVPDVKAGLIAEIERRNDPDINTPAVLFKLNQFLFDVVFVFDKYGKSDYIKSIIEFKNVSKLDDEFLIRIFDEIRTQQASKKIRSVYGQEVASIQEAEKFEKNIYRKDIDSLLLDPAQARQGIPLYFVQEVQGMDAEDIADLIQECQAQISRTLFNKNNKSAFWLLLEEIMTTFEKNSGAGIRVVLGKISSQAKNRVFTLDETALLYPWRAGSLCRQSSGPCRGCPAEPSDHRSGRTRGCFPDS